MCAWVWSHRILLLSDNTGLRYIRMDYERLSQTEVELLNIHDGCDVSEPAHTGRGGFAFTGE